MDGGVKREQKRYRCVLKGEGMHDMCGCVLLLIVRKHDKLCGWVAESETREEKGTDGWGGA